MSAARSDSSSSLSSLSSDATTSSPSTSSDEDSSSSNHSSTPASPSRRPVHASGGGGWRMTPNPDLAFTKGDVEGIPMPRLETPAEVAVVLQRMTGDKRLYPEGRYRALDYFRVAVEMFVDAVRAEYAHQRDSAAKNGKTLNRFTWRNNGELAVCFACCCDWMKLLHTRLQPNASRPNQAAFASQMVTMLIGLSGVPAEILSSKTYETKYYDWVKGGTRYNRGQASANVRFPSAQSRREKIEAYLKSQGGLKIDTIKVNLLNPPAGRPQVGAVPTAPSANLQVKSAGTSSGATPGNAAPPFVAPFSPAHGPGPVRAPGSPAGPRAPIAIKSSAAAARARHPPAPSAVKQMPEEMRHLYWLSSLAHIKGGEPGAAFPEERTAALPGLVRLCEITELPSEVAVLVDVVASSTEMVQQVFETLGGIVSLRRLFGRVVKQSVTKGCGDVVRFIERVAHVKALRWSSASQCAWRTGMDGKLTDDLTWLRALPVIPVAKRAAWGALVLVMEEKFIFRLPREEAEASRKRARLEASSAALGGGGGVNMESMRAAAADNVDIQHWKVPRVYTLSTVRLPAELRTPPFTSSVEAESLEFLNRKRQFAEATQAEWEQRLRSMLKASVPAAVAHQIHIPVWYDPFQLLGVDSTG